MSNKPSDEFQAAPQAAASRLLRTILFCSAAFAASLGASRLLDPSDEPAFIGNLQVQVTEVRVPHTGRVAALHVSVGDRIAPGEVLGEIIDDRHRESLEHQRHEVQALQAELQQAQAQARIELSWRLRSLESEILRTQLDLANYMKEKFACQIRHKAWEQIGQDDELVGQRSRDDVVVQSLVCEPPETHSDRVLAMLEHESAANSAEVYTVQIELCDARIERLESLKTELPQIVKSASGVDLIETRLQQAQTELELLETEAGMLQLRSTTYGEVSALEISVGDEVRAGELAIRVMDAHQKSVIVHIPSQRIPHFRDGRHVQLTFPGEQRREGRVRSVAAVATACTQVAAGEVAALGGDALIPVEIEPAGKLWPEVPVGAAVEVRVAQHPADTES